MARKRIAVYDTDREGNPVGPGLSQRRFHNSLAKFKGFCGPVGSGKTRAGANEAIKLAIQNPGLPGIFGAPSYPHLRDVVIPTVRDILDASGITYSYNQQKNRILLKKGRSEIFFRSCKDPNRLRGPNIAWFLVDEQTYVPWASVQQLIARLRHKMARRLCGAGLFTPKGYDKVYEFYHEPGQAGKRELILAKAKENAKNLAEGYYEDLERSLDSQMAKQEVYGLFVNVFAGQCYFAFSRERHVKTVEYDPALPLCWAIDFNVDPFCAVVGQFHNGSPGFAPIQKAVPMSIRVLDEIALRGADTDAMCREFVSRWAERHGARPLYIYGDPAGNARSTKASKSDWQLIREFFTADQTARMMRPEFRLLSAAPMVKDRVTVVNAKLRNAIGESFFTFDPRCKELIADCERVSWSKGSDGAVMDKKADHDRTHMSDALGYWVWYEWPLRSKAGEQGKRLL